MRDLYIFDIDGTLADCSHRIDVLADRSDQDRHMKFAQLCHLDAPVTAVLRTMHALRRSADIWLFTGRSDQWRRQTVEWLREHAGLSAEELDTSLVMRRAGDTRSDAVVKREFLDAMLECDRARLVAVFEDRDRVVSMWRAAGIPCFQVAPGGF